MWGLEIYCNIIMIIQGLQRDTIFQTLTFWVWEIYGLSENGATQFNLRFTNLAGCSSHMGVSENSGYLILGSL